MMVGYLRIDSVAGGKVRYVTFAITYFISSDCNSDKGIVGWAMDELVSVEMRCFSIINEGGREFDPVRFWWCFGVWIAGSLGVGFGGEGLS